MGSTEEEEGPLMRRTETVPPGGRWRAYLARRVSIPWMGVVLGLAVPLVGAGGGRLRFVLTMLVEVCGCGRGKRGKNTNGVNLRR